MNFYSIPPLVSSVSFIAFGLFVYLKNPKSIVNQLFFYLCVTTFIWQFSWTFLFLKPSDEILTLLIKIGYTGILFLPVVYFHFICEFVGNTTSKKDAYFGYLLAGALLVLLWTTPFFINGFKVVPWGVYPRAGFLHPIYLVMVIYFTFKGMLLFFGELKNVKSDSKKKNQLKYLLWALVIFAPSASDFIINYNFNYYPIGFVFITGFLFVTGTGIAKHQLLDIEVVIKRATVFAGLFTFVYGVFTVVSVIGQEFFKNSLGWNQWVSMVPTVLIITFSLRPLEIFLTNATEKFLFQKKYDYRVLLKTFTNEILTVLELQKLMDQTVAGLMRIIKLESATMLLLDKDAQVYKIVASNGLKDKNLVFKESDAVISYIKQTHEPILKDKDADKMDGFSSLKDDFKKLNAQLCLPVALHDELTGIMCLGMKKSGEEFTQEDIDILTTLARTEAIAIANAQLFDQLSKTQAEAAQREKMAVIGTLAAGINHEICNPLGIVRGQCEMFLLNLRDGIYTTKTKEDMCQIATDIMNKVIKETDRATGITKKLSGFAKPAKKTESEEVFVEKEAEEVLGLIGHDLKLNNITFSKSFAADFPPIFADKRQIQEVLFNIIRNAAQAMDKKDGKISLSGMNINGSAVVKIADNGSGIPPDKIVQIFNPFFTTKEPGKGTGLGLFIVKQVVERNKGTIAVDSQEGVGTTFTLTFPTAEHAKAMAA